MKKRYKILIFTCLLILNFYLLALVHELSHMYDYRHIEKENEKICVWFGCGGDIAYYYAQFNENDKNCLIVDEYTEKNAIISSITYSIISLIILCYIGYKMKIDQVLFN